MSTPIYLDHHATTPPDPRVVEAMLPFLTREFGNPASRTHAWGWRAEAALEAAREDVSGALGARSSREIIFTSGATEANNLALVGGARAAAARGRHLVTVATEHPSVLEPCRALAEEGFELTVLAVGRDGLLDPEAVARALRPDTVLVSVMAANNEIGVLQPLAEIGAICRERGVWLHSDATQAVASLPLDLASLPVDLVSLSAHKVYGPKGVGALYVRGGRPRVRLTPLVRGGGHERGLRSGTVPVFLAVGLARALTIAAAEREAEAARIAGLRDRLLVRLQEGLDGVTVNGSLTRRLPGNLNVSFDGVDGEAVLAGLPDIAVSSGSACSSSHPEPSPVLKALGLPDDLVRASLRFGIGRTNTRAEIERAADRVIETVRAVRAARRSRAEFSGSAERAVGERSTR